MTCQSNVEIFHIYIFSFLLTKQNCYSFPNVLVRIFIFRNNYNYKGFSNKDLISRYLLWTLSKTYSSIYTLLSYFTLGFNSKSNFAERYSRGEKNSTPTYSVCLCAERTIFSVAPNRILSIRIHKRVLFLGLRRVHRLEHKNARTI